MFTHQILRNLLFPLVAVRQQFLLVVQQFFVGLGRELEIGTLDNSVHWTSFLTKSAVDALGHVNIVSRGSSSTILAFFHFNRNRLRRADGLAQLTSDATLITTWVSSKSMFSTETGTEVSFFIGVVNSHTRLEHDFGRQPKRTPNLRQEKILRGTIKNSFP